MHHLRTFAVDFRKTLSEDPARYRAMKPIPSDFERSIRRSRVRLQVLLCLSSLGEAYVGQLARHTRVPHYRVRAALLGAPPTYGEKLSLVGLGLARPVSMRGGQAFEITTRGRRKARSITAAWARQRSSAELWRAGGLGLAGDASGGRNDERT